MKKRIGIIVLTSLVAVSTVSALQVTVGVNPGAHQWPGGEFLVTPVGGGDPWESFCMEIGEGLPGGVYNATYGDRAYYGGPPPAGGPSGDPLSVGVAWLYSKFRNGSLPGYDYNFGAGRKASAWALQNAIWMLEDESSPSMDPLAGQYYYDLAQSTFSGQAKADNAGRFSVYVVNLTTESGARVQDQLDRLPDGGSMLGLLGLSLASLRVFARKRR